MIKSSRTSKLLTAAGLGLFSLSMAGCSDSGAGIAYDRLPEPTTPAFAEWAPLSQPESEASFSNEPPETGPNGSPKEPNENQTETNSQQPANAEDVVASNSQEPSVSSSNDATTGQIAQVNAETQDDSVGEVSPAVAVTPSKEDDPKSLSPSTDDMTAQERMNLLMNNPDLVEDTEILEPKLLIPDKRFRKEEGGQITRVSYDDIDLLKVLNMQPVPPDAVDYFPDWLNQLDGQRIRIRGFMIPPFQATGLKRFALARDNGICCFVRTPKIYDVINVRMADGKTTDYIANKPFDVEGIFRIDPFADDGELYDLYKIEDAIVIE